MAETKDSQDNIAYIRTHVENVERMVRFQISANPHSRELIQKSLARRQGMAELYLALGDGPLTQDELCEKLHMSQANVSKIMKELFESGMVDKVPSAKDSRKMAYKWSDYEEMLGVSRLAREYIETRSSKAKAKPKKQKTILSSAPEAAVGNGLDPSSKTNT